MANNSDQKSIENNSIDKAKPKKTKSRNGCVTCKKRRLKCDETKPLCQNCIKKGIVCGGYAINFKWRDFSETSNSHKKLDNYNHNLNHNHNHIHAHDNNHTNQFKKISSNNINSEVIINNKNLPIKSHDKSNDLKEYNNKLKESFDDNSKLKTNSNIVNNPLQKALEEATLSVTGKSTQEIAIANALIASGKNPDLAAAVASTLNGLINNNEILNLVSKNQLDNIKNNIKIENSLDTNSDSSDSKPNFDKKISKSDVNNKITDTKNINIEKKSQSLLDEKSQIEENNNDKAEENITNIQPNKLVNNNTNINASPSINKSNTSLLHSLADIASKIPASPIGPLSPFNEPFPSDAFIQKYRKKSLSDSNNNKPPLIVTSNFKMSNNILPPLPSDLISKNKKDSPLNLFKDSPQQNSSVYSPPLFPKSPGISNMLANYQNSSNNDNQNLSNAQTPKFIDDLDVYSNLQQFVKFSPSGIENFSTNLENQNNSNSNSKIKTMNSNNQNSNSIMSPPIFNLLSTVTSNNNNESINSVMSNFSNFTNSSSNTNDQLQVYPNVGVSPMFDIETPKPINSTPNSPYTTMLSYINSTQVPEKEESKSNNNKNDNIHQIEEINSNTNNDNNNNNNDNNNIMTTFNKDPYSPRSNTSEMNSPLDIFEHPNRAQIILQQKPVNLYSLHLSDENLSTLVAFDQYTCGIMSIKNGPTENPWRTFLLPMSIDHPVVRSALLAMTCFHVARGDPTIRERGVRYMKDAIVTLVHSLSSDSKDKNKNSKSITSSSSASGAANERSSNNSDIDSSKEIIKRTPPDVALATCIALAMGEAWDRHISTGIAHLKGAKSMIIRVLNKIEGKKRNKKKRSRSNSSNITEIDSIPMNKNDSMMGNTSDKIESLHSDENDNDNDLHKKKLPKELQFLVNAWMYFDVLARMTSENDEEFPDEDSDNDEAIELNSVDGDLDSDESNGNGMINGINDEINNRPLKRSTSQNYGCSHSNKRAKLYKKKRRNSNNSSSVIAKFMKFNLEDGDKIDPLLGVAQTLFPIMSDVATLIEQVRRIKSKGKKNIDKNMKTPLRLISKAVELKNAIERWKIPSLVNVPDSIHTEDPTFDLNAAVATAEAYRYSVLLYLHQAVPEVPSQSSHSLAENVMMLLASVPTSSRTLVTHLFPLFVASCEATPGEEREWARERWNELSQKMWIGTIERAWEVVKEVWARKDALAGKKNSRIFAEKDSNQEIAILQQNEENNEVEYNKVKRRISMVIHGNDAESATDDDNKLGSWTHWTTVMKEWGWEVLLA